METEENFQTNVIEMYDKDITKGPINISVITLCANLNSRIDINKLRENQNIIYKNFKNTRIHKIKNKVKNNKYEIKNKIKKNIFNNCFIFSLEHMDSKNISVKIFINGKLQITGCKNIEIAKNIVNIIVNIIEYMDNIYSIIENKQTFKLDSLEIAMINSGFKLNFEINQYLLASQLKPDDIIKYVSFQPDKYCGINIKCINNTSVFIFRSGAVNISGSKNTDNLKKIYNHIINILKNYN